jgi:hypothetical protein
MASEKGFVLVQKSKSLHFSDNIKEVVVMSVEY